LGQTKPRDLQDIL